MRDPISCSGTPELPNALESLGAALGLAHRRAEPVSTETAGAEAALTPSTAAELLPPCEHEKVHRGLVANLWVTACVTNEARRHCAAPTDAMAGRTRYVRRKWRRALQGQRKREAQVVRAQRDAGHGVGANRVIHTAYLEQIADAIHWHQHHCL